MPSLAIQDEVDQSPRPRPFRIDAAGDVGSDPVQLEAAALEAETAGYDGMLATEIRHDPFIGLTLAARSTERLELFSGIAVALARNPMSMAVLANDVHLVSAGRLSLGLGTQVRPHIERRFSMPWSHPARRMSEYVAAIRAIWESWATGEALAFEGEFYRHTLMTPFFSPGPNPFGNPSIWLAAVGELMTQSAGEVADGMLAHSFTTRAYMDEVTLPALRRGRVASGRSVADLELSVPALVAVGNDRAELDLATQATRQQVAFYGSTPAYRHVLDLHGWGDLAVRLNALSRRGEWDEMTALIGDDVFTEFALVGSPSEVAHQLIERFGGLATRVSFNTPYVIDHRALDDVVAALSV